MGSLKASYTFLLLLLLQCMNYPAFAVWRVGSNQHVESSGFAAEAGQSRDAERAWRGGGRHPSVKALCPLGLSLAYIYMHIF